MGDMYGDTIGVLCFYQEVSLKLIRYVSNTMEKDIKLSIL